MKSKKRVLIALILGITLIIVLVAAGSRTNLFSPLVPSTDAKSEPLPATGEAGSIVLACPGRIEGDSEAISVGAGIDGVIAQMRVKEGEQVAAGDVITEIF